jgi:hypothetical protein
MIDDQITIDRADLADLLYMAAWFRPQCEAYGLHSGVVIERTKRAMNRTKSPWSYGYSFAIHCARHL